MLITFGDVFRYREKNYVYLDRTEEIVYAALILPTEDTILLEEQYNRVSKQPHRLEQLKNHPLYCYVILRTENFRDRAAYLGKPEMDNDLNLDVVSKLNKEDLQEIKKEIMLKDSPVSHKLKELIADIEV